MTKDRFAQLCAETRIPAEIINDLWDARAPMLEDDRGALDTEVRDMLDLIARAIEADALPDLRRFLITLGAHLDAGKN